MIQALMLTLSSMSLAQVKSQTCNGIDRCSTSAACACFQVAYTSNTTICIDQFLLSCSELVRCEGSNYRCVEPDHLCIYHSRCHNFPVCYPVPSFNSQYCPLKLIPTEVSENITIAFWPFDSNTLELYNTDMHATSVNNPTYTTSFTGYGAAINLAQSSNQYVYIASNVIPLNLRSFTIEAWIYPTSLSNMHSYGIFGQCQSRNEDFCFHFTTQQNMLYCGFFNNDVQGNTTITNNRWYHVACSYDFVSMKQEVWLDGFIDGSRVASPYKGKFGNTTIGATFEWGKLTTFDGYIDNVRFELRAKSSSEMLNDATLHVYHSFDDDSLVDNGPNGINGSAFGSLSYTEGRVKRAVVLNSGPYISYLYSPFYFLGINIHPVSIVLWVKTTRISTAQTLVLVEGNTIWCVQYLVIKSDGVLTANSWNGSHILTGGPILPLNTWTHIGYTYSRINGLRLYINGSQYSSTNPFDFSVYDHSMKMKLGGYGGKPCTPAYTGAFTGALDEFYVYRRELAAWEVYDLANVQV